VVVMPLGLALRTLFYWKSLFCKYSMSSPV